MWCSVLYYTSIFLSFVSNGVRQKQNTASHSTPAQHEKKTSGVGDLCVYLKKKMLRFPRFLYAPAWASIKLLIVEYSGVHEYVRTRATNRDDAMRQQPTPSISSTAVHHPATHTSRRHSQVSCCARYQRELRHRTPIGVT